MNAMADQRAALIEHLHKTLLELRHYAQAAPPSDPAPAAAFDLAIEDDAVSLIISDDNGGGEETAHPVGYRMRVTFKDGNISDVTYDDLPGPRWQKDDDGDSAAALAKVMQAVGERYLGLVHAGNAPEHVFQCPFCDVVAETSIEQQTVCSSRRCVCGALGLANPAVDQDEIIDDALNVLAVAVPAAAAGSDAALLQSISDAGYEMRLGWSGGSDLHPWGPQMTMWFRRTEP